VCAIAKSKSQKRIIPVQGKNDIICNHLVSLKKITNLIEIQSCDKCYYQAKDKRQKDVEMADIEPSIQFESLSDRINIFAIKQILANSGH